MRREPAWRVFAAEFNDSTIELKSTEEKTPSYVITPLGSKINRVFIAGVLTDVENITEGGEYLRAHISDPTGVFTLYSGQFQQTATDQLLRIQVPSFVAVVGKVRTYQPEEGTMYVSIRPENIQSVVAATRDQWIVETCKQTKHRISAMIEAMKLSHPNTYDLRKLGYSPDLSEGVVTALQKYGPIDVTKYITLIRESLQYVSPTKETFTEIQDREQKERLEQKTPPKKNKKHDKKTKEQAPPSEEADVETIVLEAIKELESDEGAAWDLIIEHCKKIGLDENSIEEALNSLMDKGMIFEPILGTIKLT